MLSDDWWNRSWDCGRGVFQAAVRRCDVLCIGCPGVVQKAERVLIRAAVGGE